MTPPRMWLADRMRRGGRTSAVAAVAAVLVCPACTEENQPAPVVTTDQAGRTVVVTPDPIEDADTDRQTATQPADPVPTTLPVPTAEASGQTQQPPEQAVLVRVRLDVPGGWTVQDMGEPVLATQRPGLVPPNQWCLVPPQPVPVLDGCAGVIVAVGGDWLPGAAGEPYAAQQESAWLASTEPLLCPFDPEAALDEEGEGNVVVTDAEGAPLTSTTTEVGGLDMRYETWRARCTTTGETFTPQLWHVPELDVLVKDYFGSPQTVPMLGTLEGT